MERYIGLDVDKVDLITLSNYSASLTNHLSCAVERSAILCKVRSVRRRQRRPAVDYVALELHLAKHRNQLFRAR